VVAVLKIDDLSDAEVDGGDVLDEVIAREALKAFLWGGGGGGGIRRLEVVDDELGKLVSGRGRGLRDGDVTGVCVIDVVPAEAFVRDLLGRSGSRGGIGGLFGGKLPYAKS
jgi:hypothetical protein